jgi:hypothetical protein
MLDHPRARSGPGIAILGSHCVMLAHEEAGRGPRHRFPVRTGFSFRWRGTGLGLPLALLDRVGHRSSRSNELARQA